MKKKIIHEENDEVSSKNKVEDLVETLQRLQAEFENYKKRVDKEKEDFQRYSKADLVYKLLTVLDTFEIALKSTNDHEKFVKGMEMVYAQLFSTLESEGLKPIDITGKKLDPFYHEVMLKEKSEGEEGMIVQELQKGYTFNGRVLRHSKVKVSEKIEESKENSGEKEQP
jgi:molecular chaperone GrpE